MRNISVQTPARILIVDDSSTARSLLKKVIESRSKLWKVCGEAADGLEGVQQAMRLNPDLVIMDLQMPVMDGLTASQRIGKSLPRVLILMNTIHKSEYVDSEARKAGIKVVISKPDSNALIRAVEGLLGRGGGGPEVSGENKARP